MVFAIRMLLYQIYFIVDSRDKNSSLFSPFTYAYLKDRGLFDAIIQLRSFLGSGTLHTRILLIRYQRNFCKIPIKEIKYFNKFRSEELRKIFFVMHC